MILVGLLGEWIHERAPLPVARFSVLLMHSTRGKCYSVGEIGAILDELGFQEPAYADTTGNRSIIMAVKPQ